MKVAIAHTGPASELVVASSVMNGIKKYSINTDITWIVSDQSTYIFKYNRDVRKTFTRKEFLSQDEEYDLLINLWPDIIERRHGIAEHMGFGTDRYYDRFRGALINTVSISNMNSFQLYFRLAGLTWKGEGYNIIYYPKTKTKKGRIGMSAVNANLRNYVLDNLEIDDKKIWSIPYKKNIFKRMDEINRCKKIITDDLLTFHLALSMRKYAHYLKTYPHNLELETFNNGQVHPVHYSYLK